MRKLAIIKVELTWQVFTVLWLPFLHAMWSGLLQFQNIVFKKWRWWNLSVLVWHFRSWICFLYLQCFWKAYIENIRSNTDFGACWNDKDQKSMEQSWTHSMWGVDNKYTTYRRVHAVIVVIHQQEGAVTTLTASWACLVDQHAMNWSSSW
jgi:hypothetical protein